jgi:hypothetical protein
MGDFLKVDSIVGIGATLAATAIGGPVAGLAIGSAAASTIGQRRATQAREVELTLMQRQEESASRDREVQRQRRINALMGAQAAQAAAQGVQLSGSVGNISLEDARLAGEASMIDDINTRQRIDALSRNRATLTSQSNFRTATQILNTADRFVSR